MPFSMVMLKLPSTAAVTFVTAVSFR